MSGAATHPVAPFRLLEDDSFASWEMAYPPQNDSAGYGSPFASHDESAEKKQTNQSSPAKNQEPSRHTEVTEVTSSSSSEVPRLQRSATASLSQTSAFKVASMNLGTSGYANKRTGSEHWWDPQGEYLRWSTMRKRVAAMVFSQLFDHIMSLIIVFNLVLIVYQTNEEAKCFPDYKDFLDCPLSGQNILWMKAANVALLTIYGFEAALKIYAAHAAYFKHKDNILDFAICIITVVAEMASMSSQFTAGMEWLRMVRLWRLARVVQGMSSVHEIKLLIVYLAGALRAMFFGALLLILSLLFCSLILVQVLHPVNVDIHHSETCERCSRGFQSVEHSMLTLFQQIVAGDSWGTISVPLIEHSPFLGLLLPAVQLFIGIGIMNLILAVVVDQAAESREEKKEDLERRRLDMVRDRKHSLLRIISSFDRDNSGTLSRAEVRGLLGEKEVQNIMIAADLGPSDVEMLIESLENSGEMRYEELVNVIHQIESGNLRKLAVLSDVIMTREFLRQKQFGESHSEILARIEKTCLKSLIKLDSKIDVLLKKSSSEGNSSCSGVRGFRRAITENGLLPEGGSSQSTTHPLTTSEVEMHQLRDRLDRCQLPAHENAECLNLENVVSDAHSQLLVDLREKIQQPTQENEARIKLESVVAEAHSRLLVNLQDFRAELGDLRRTAQLQHEMLMHEWSSNPHAGILLSGTQRQSFDHVRELNSRHARWPASKPHGEHCGECEEKVNL